MKETYSDMLNNAYGNKNYRLDDNELTQIAVDGVTIHINSDDAEILFDRNHIPNLIWVEEIQNEREDVTSESLAKRIMEICHGSS